MVKQYLYGSDVLDMSINQRSFDSSDRIGSISRCVKPDFIIPPNQHSGVLACAKMRRVMYLARKQIVLRSQMLLFDPSSHRFACGGRDFELYGPLGFLLRDGGAWCHLFTVANVAHLQLHQVAAA
jgi:hypothetical protein